MTTSCTSCTKRVSGTTKKETGTFHCSLSIRKTKTSLFQQSMPKNEFSRLKMSENWIYRETRMCQIRWIRPLIRTNLGKKVTSIGRTTSHLLARSRQAIMMPLQVMTSLNKTQLRSPEIMRVKCIMKAHIRSTEVFTVWPSHLFKTSLSKLFLREGRSILTNQARGDTLRMK